MGSEIVALLRLQTVQSACGDNLPSKGERERGGGDRGKREKKKRKQNKKTNTKRIVGGGGLVQGVTHRQAGSVDGCVFSCW